MTIFRSERAAAVVLALAAVAGLVIANSPIGTAVVGVRDAHPDTGVSILDLSLGHWIADGLLALFFFVVAIELRHELTHGELDSPRKALAPAVAATGGVIVPALLFLVLVRDPTELVGWPIPTATDIAFALGVLALLGRGLPRRVRAFLLALAVLDDLIAIAIIAAFFTRELAPIPLLVAVPLIAAFGWISARSTWPAGVRTAVLIVLGVATWVLVFSSGVHATIAGVALGLVFASKPGERLRHALEPWVNGLVLPLFALSASMVVVPEIRDGGLGPLFWGVFIALPAGKLIGISAGGLIARQLVPASERRAALRLPEILVVATLGGVGFTISLLMAELAFRGDETLVASATLAVLAGSLVALVVGGVTTATVARRSRFSS
ncbi:Na+/H+ antiporter NhaA [Homoserinibacter sp. GY 40078]|uniref:Na+/H+ antiporter NhaA n=1 Tax=Homoserinibacter sp. GY 40078 TaxID=2603275 RepID=UPI0011C9A389|nr:Na+/H+ antiporter NhaA [Homoserinibacter sp. GY 40078]TXK17509.1 Na+/H+ antiporter NhaA [Homoserinibacter sp. GY 40078]